jgi:hypothetical protein
MPENLADTSAQFGRWRWDLRYAHSALVIIQKHAGGLKKLSTQLIERSGALMTNPLPDDQAALLIWAGEAWRSPKLTLAKVQKRLTEMTDMERKLLGVWAAAQFLMAVLELTEAQVDKLLPAADDD